MGTVSYVMIGDLEIDATPFEEVVFENEITEHPVEDGADITDHVRARQVMLHLDCVVSDTPIGPIAARRQPDTLPASDALAQIRAIYESRLPVTVTTSSGTYLNMVLETLPIPRDASTGDALKFRASFRQIKLVTNERTTIPVATPRAARRVNRGNKPSPDERARVLLEEAVADSRANATRFEAPNKLDVEKDAKQFATRHAQLVFAPIGAQ